MECKLYFTYKFLPILAVSEIIIDYRNDRNAYQHRKCIKHYIRLMPVLTLVIGAYPKMVFAF